MNRSPGTARAFGRTIRDVIDWRGQPDTFSNTSMGWGSPAMALFWGERDMVIPVHHDESMRTVFENCPIVRFPGGPFLHWQAPATLAGAIDEPLYQAARLAKRLPRPPRPVPKVPS
jgi:pimeloyl-ACP methyl ester carboxylesterase